LTNWAVVPSIPADDEGRVEVDTMRIVDSIKIARPVPGGGERAVVRRIKAKVIS